MFNVLACRSPESCLLDLRKLDISVSSISADQKEYLKKCSLLSLYISHLTQAELYLRLILSKQDLHNEKISWHAQCGWGKFHEASHLDTELQSASQRLLGEDESFFSNELPDRISKWSACNTHTYAQH